MAPPRRSTRPQARSSNRLASLLFALGCLAVLGVTFALGVAAGRRWPHGFPGFTASSSDASAATSGRSERDRRGEGQGLAKTISEAPPVLTFYRELTAPLTPPSAPPRAAKTDAKAKEHDAKPKDTPKPRPAETIKSAAPESGEGRFTVQVGAFKTRAQADAMHARLAAGGQPAYVSEAEADGATQYRVRVGSFATREAAREAAARLASERQLATYVTTR